MKGSNFQNTLIINCYFDNANMKGSNFQNTKINSIVMVDNVGIRIWKMVIQYGKTVFFLVETAAHQSFIAHQSQHFSVSMQECCEKSKWITSNDRSCRMLHKVHLRCEQFSWS